MNEAFDRGGAAMRRLDKISASLWVARREVVDRDHMADDGTAVYIDPQRNIALASASLRIIDSPWRINARGPGEQQYERTGQKL